MNSDKVTKEEVKATKAVLDALTEIPREVARRVISSVSMLLGLPVPAASGSKEFDQSRRHIPQANPAIEGGYSDLPALMAAAKPKDGPERALVVAYWKQVCEKQSDWTGLYVNGELKNLGHQLANVTTTLKSLMERNPKLVIQTKKTGKAQQARKLYRLTEAGINVVEKMLSGEGADDAN